jgi:hypothetical protein
MNVLNLNGEIDTSIAVDTLIAVIDVDHAVEGRVPILKSVGLYEMTTRQWDPSGKLKSLERTWFTSYTLNAASKTWIPRDKAVSWLKQADVRIMNNGLARFLLMTDGSPEQTLVFEVLEL